MLDIKRASVFIGWLILMSQPAWSATFSLTPGDDVVGENQIITAKQGDNFASLAKHYGLSLHEIKEANPGIKKLHEGQKVLLSTQFILPAAKYRYQPGIVVNMSELRLYFFRPDGKTVDTYPVAMGRPGWRTPVMKTSVVSKEAQPTWHVPNSIHDYMYAVHGIDLPDNIPPGPRNPLGPYALHIGNAGYLIHGNNQVQSIGTYASSGCIRMYNEDITELFSRVPVNTVVYIVNHQHKAGWKGDKLFFKAQQAVSLNKPDTDLNLITPEEVIAEATLNRPVQVDWKKVNRIVDDETGVPQQIN